ncbi:HAMP domain-containing protein [Leptospira langatensis]|uniref:histidine kinase n=1 Tax=Leptospira langatensis TaxID=2484983 RepID=A0A5F1ZVT7_9LEPT|nr:ATP-binding protein [Leptospira langatensis]TGK01166.1 HAMP domain-containing protein [Leptospira langatensis]TGL42382.1 HAMP domain-containing protein [Leptospira langatensis]
MNLAIQRLEEIFASIPLPLMDIWGRFGYIVGIFLMVSAFGGFTFRAGGNWSFGRQRQIWDAPALLSVAFTFVLIFVTGYIGSFIVLVPGAQTFESLKDLSVFVCILLFGYPALIAVPFAYGLSDLIEGVPPNFLMDWILGYFINPSCFWVAYQLIGRNPDFRRIRTWFLYSIFVIIFMGIEPQLWGYICSDQFTPEISYRNITPALFFTTGITWIIAPFAVLIAYPLSRRYNLFWAEIPGHTQESILSYKEWYWENGKKGMEKLGRGWPVRMFLVAPFIFLVLVLVGSTAYLTLRSSELAADKLASRLHQEISENINLQLDDSISKSSSLDFEKIDKILHNTNIAKSGRAFIIDREGNEIASSLDAKGENLLVSESSDLVAKNAVQALISESKDLKMVKASFQFRFDVVTAKPVSRETWLAQITPYQDPSGEVQWIVITAMPASYYLEGVRLGNSESAKVFAIALLLSLLVAVFLAGVVTAPISRISEASQAMAEGDLTQRVPTSRLEELGTLSLSFNHMAEQLQDAFHKMKSIEGKLLERNQFIESILDITPDILYIYDLKERKNVYANNGIYRILGYSVDNVQEMDANVMPNLMHPDDLENYTKNVYPKYFSASDKDLIEFQYRLKHVNGEWVWLVSRALIYQREPDGTPRQVFGIANDITKSKQSEELILDLNANLERRIDLRTEELKKSNSDLIEALEYQKSIMKELKDTQDQLLLSEKLAALGQLAAGMTHELNTPLGAIVSSNRAILEILYTEIKEIPDLILNLDTEERANFKILLEESLKEISQSEILPNRALRKELSANLKEWNIPNHENVANLILEMGLHRLGNRLPELLRGRNSLKTLNAISSIASVVRLSNVISIATGKASYVVDALKHYLNPGERKIEENETFPIDVEAEIETILTLYQNKIKFGVEIVKRFETKEKCLGDANQLNQVWINLLNNGLQAINYEGKIEIAIEKIENWIVVSFIDFGSGIPKEIQGKIFDPFFTTKKPGEGIGIGLDISKKIVERIGGKIEFESRPGRTKFSVWLKSVNSEKGEPIGNQD